MSEVHDAPNTPDVPRKHDEQPPSSDSPPSRQRIWPAAGTSRRQFLRTAALASAAFVVPRHVLGGVGYQAPSDVITRGVIGTGGMGMGHVVANQAGKAPVTLAVCDVDKNHLRSALNKAGAPCEGYSDWRRVLERTDLDTIHIATPPHWHGLIGIAAAQAGFDLFTEKPFTRTIGEGVAYRDTVRHYGRMLQINTHSRFGNYYGHGQSQVLRKLVASGVLGSPLTATVGRHQGFNWKIRMWSGREHLPVQPVPEVLDYNMWLGPAPEKPYHPHRVHGSFRGYWDYDGGGLADMGQHYLDPLQYIMGKDDTSPAKISADAPWPCHPDAVGLWGRVTLEYADGDKVILESGEWGDESPPDTPLLSGPNGKVFRNYRTEPGGLIADIRHLPDPEPLLNFETAVKTRQLAGGNEGPAHRSCSLVNLANIAIRTGRSLQFDPVAERFVNDEAANRLINPPMRAPWKL